MSSYKNKDLEKYTMHRLNAEGGGKKFLLTFDEWLKIWLDSGHYHERGRKRGQYVMARFGDDGPYAIGNVKIITTEENVSEGHANWSISDEGRESIRQSKLGKPRPDLAEFNRSRTGIPLKPEHAAKIRPKVGKKRGPYKNRGRPIDPEIVAARLGRKRGPYNLKRRKPCLVSI